MVLAGTCHRYRSLPKWSQQGEYDNPPLLSRDRPHKLSNALVRHRLVEATLPDEVRAVIIASWKRGGLLPRAAVEELVPEQSLYSTKT
jgi:hypothetical protein